MVILSLHMAPGGLVSSPNRQVNRCYFKTEQNWGRTCIFPIQCRTDVRIKGQRLGKNGNVTISQNPPFLRGNDRPTFPPQKTSHNYKAEKQPVTNPKSIII